MHPISNNVTNRPQQQQSSQVTKIIQNGRSKTPVSNQETSDKR